MELEELAEDVAHLRNALRTIRADLAVHRTLLHAWMTSLAPDELEALQHNFSLDASRLMAGGLFRQTDPTDQDLRLVQAALDFSEAQLVDLLKARGS